MFSLVVPPAVRYHFPHKDAGAIILVVVERVIPRLHNYVLYLQNSPSGINMYHIYGSAAIFVLFSLRQFLKYCVR